ncbi:MAG: hypothetical protein U0930_23565 [Pirellulales bacterium]
MTRTTISNKTKQKARFNVDNAIALALKGALSSAPKSTIIKTLMLGMQNDSALRQSLALTFIPEQFSPFAPISGKPKPTRIKAAKRAKSSKSSTK